MKIARCAIGPPQGSTPRDCPSTSAHAGAKTKSGSRCQSLAMPNGWCRMHGDLRPALRRGIRSSARHGRRCGAACTVLALLRRADPAEWPLCATTGRSLNSPPRFCHRRKSTVATESAQKRSLRPSARGDAAGVVQSSSASNSTGCLSPRLGRNGWRKPGRRSEP
jgi:hypothetical protein